MTDFRLPITVLVQSQIKQDGESQQSKLSAKGELFRRGDRYYLRYVEGKAHTTTLVHWNEGKSELWVTRTGEINVRQHFLPNTETTALYITPFASFPLVTFTKSIENRIEGGGEELVIEYTARLGEHGTSEHLLMLRIERN